MFNSLTDFLMAAIDTDIDVEVPTKVYKHYRYTGCDPFFNPNETAIGRFCAKTFEIQVDRFKHPWSHGWHLTPICDWEPIE